MTAPATPARLFEIYGIEIEYMLVDAENFDVRPVAPAVLLDAEGRVSNTVEDGDITWSNELAAHVIELKTTAPAPDLESLPDRFFASLNRLRLRLPDGVTLMPSAAHPWMSPEREFTRWVDEDAEIYETFDRIFDCRGHGWSNLQSVHVNLPFASDAEFARLHEAIRLVLPIIPALSAASPILDGKIQPDLDARLRVYGSNAARVPEVSGLVIPEAVRSRTEYEARILEPLYAALAPHDPAGVLRFEWANARGAIARFDRDAIEIRTIDAQECPRMDLAVAAAVVALVRSLVEDGDLEAPLPTERLAAVYRDAVAFGDRALVEDAGYLQRLGLPGAPIPASEIWGRRLDALGTARPGSPWGADLALLLEQGPLARRILRQLPPDPRREDLRSTAGALVRCLETNAPLRVE